MKTSFGSSTSIPVPRSGDILSRLILVGAAIEFMYSENLIISMPLTEISGEMRSRLKKLTRK